MFCLGAWGAAHLILFQEGFGASSSQGIAAEALLTLQDEAMVGAEAKRPLG